MSAHMGNSGVLTVSQALQLAKGNLEALHVTIEGEVSELSNKPGYKAVYFTLSDRGGALPCLMWNSDYRRNGIDLRQGMLVQISGSFSLYVQKGRMNFVARSIRPAGEGELRMKVAMLAKKLQAEGLIDPARKKPVPAFVEKVAVVTSPRGKAIHDVLRTMRRRCPQVEVCVCGVPVEGVAASDNICRGLEVADASDCDVILLVRGGGSYEDLMPFNDERVARTVAACSKPVITGIGHEPDNSIADMVGDLRCSTPTAAAENVTVDIAQLASSLQQAGARMGKALVSHIAFKAQSVEQLASRPLFRDPNYMLASFAMRVDADGERLSRAIPGAMQATRVKIDRCASALRAAAPNVAGAAARALERASSRLEAAGPRLLEGPKRQMSVSAARLEALSPLSVLGRGYAIAYDGDGHVMPSAATAVPGSSMEVMMQDGRIACTVDEVRISGTSCSDGQARTDGGNR